MKKQNIKIISLLVSIIGLLCLLIGSSFALLQNKNEGNKEVINVGKVKLILNITNDEFILNNSSYLTDKDAFINSEFYSFNISNVGDTPAEYDLLLVSDTTKENTLDEKYIKVGLEVNGETIIVNLKEVNNIIHSTVINKNEDIEYKLILWTDLNNLDDETILEGTTLNLKLKVNATQYMGESNTKNTFYNIMKNEVKTTNISYKYINNANITENGITYNNNDNGVFLYNGTDDNNGSLPIYYYRGNVNNNNVLFANMCWKIVRTTSTGGTKLIYNGLPDENGACNNTGEDSIIGTSAFNETRTSPADVGYMYGTRYTYASKDMSSTSTYKYGNDVTYSNGTYTLVTTKSSTTWSSDRTTLANGYHYTCFSSSVTCSSVYYITYFAYSSTAYYLTFTEGDTLETVKDKMFSNDNDSTIKKYIDNWYKDNLIDYTDMLENTIFCNDRSFASDETYTINRWEAPYTENGGALSNKGTNAVGYSYFKSYENTGKGTPRLQCENQNDRFSLSTSNGGKSGYGNNTLKYPVGLLTLDEAEFAGSQFVSSHNNYFLYTGGWYWVMTPTGFAYNYSNVGAVSATGGLPWGIEGDSIGIRPVISLKQGTIILQGSGLSSDPYVVTK